MGGALILSSIGISTLLWADLHNRYVWVVLLVTLLFGAIGWVDDYRKVIEKNSKGLPSRWKYFWQSVFGLAAAIFLYTTAPSAVETTLIIPMLKDASIPLGIGFVVLTYFVIVGSSNAVNLTDGLDGLAIMPTVMVGGALGIFCYAAADAAHEALSGARRLVDREEVGGLDDLGGFGYAGAGLFGGLGGCGGVGG